MNDTSQSLPKSCPNRESVGLDTWVIVGGWNFLDQVQIDQFLDRMEETGVKHLAFHGAPPMKPDPRHYKESLVKSQEPPPEIMSREAQVKELLQAVKDRGMAVYLYGTNPHSSGVREIYSQLHSKHFLDVDLSVNRVQSYWGACANGPHFLPYYLGRIRDVHQSFPQVDGFLNDGPEFGYEIEQGFMDNNWSLFGCFGTCCEKKAGELGYDFSQLKQAAISLMSKLTRLDSGVVQRMMDHSGEPLQALAAALEEPRLVEWFNFKRDSIDSYIKGLCQGVKSIDDSLKIGVGSRLPAFTSLTGYDLKRLAVHADFLLPKLYLWMGGVDGLYGTVYRWVKTLKAWNPKLSDELLFQFVYKLFGFTLPQVSSLKDISRYISADYLDTRKLTWLGEPFPRQFFTDVVSAQVRKMIQQVGEAWRVRPWIDTHHGGRVLTPHELHLALTAAESGGLKTCLYKCPLEAGNLEVAVKHGSKRQ